MKISETKQLLTGCIFGLIVGYVLGAYGFNVGGMFGDNTNINATSTVYEISTQDQVAGSIVTVDSVNVPVTSWVAVRENNYDVMGRILGAQKVTAGKHNSVPVELLRPTVSNVMYATVLYEDDGDDLFDFKLDRLIEVSTGTPILSRFIAH